MATRLLLKGITRYTVPSFLPSHFQIQEKWPAGQCRRLQVAISRAAECLLEPPQAIPSPKAPWHNANEDEALGADRHGELASEREGVSEKAAPRGRSKRVTARMRVMTGEEHQLQKTWIPHSTWSVLTSLHRAGHEAYLVGGCVRDMYLKRIPKDFDVLSTADPKEVKTLFKGRAFLVGRRFLICHVRSGGDIIEVSSFKTKAKIPKSNLQLVYALKHMENEETALEDSNGSVSRQERKIALLLDPGHLSRYENAIKRDFTISGLLYNPFEGILYDYVGAFRDLKQRKVRTIKPTDESFAEDPARILRAIRIAARLGFSLDSLISKALETALPVVLTIPKGRLVMEMHVLMSYGAAEASVRLLWRYRLLDILLPLHAKQLHKEKLARRSKKNNFLFDLLRNLDLLVAADNPAHGSIWTAILALALGVAEFHNVSKEAIVTAVLFKRHKQGLRAAARLALSIHSVGSTSDPKLDNGCQQEKLDVKTVHHQHKELLEKVGTALDRIGDPDVLKECILELTGLEVNNMVLVSKSSLVMAGSIFRLPLHSRKDESFREHGSWPKTPSGEDELLQTLQDLLTDIVLTTLYPCRRFKSLVELR